MKSRKQSKKITLIFSIIGIFIILNFLLFYGMKNRFEDHYNTKYGFSIKYPPEWEVKTETGIDGVAAVFLSPKSNELDTYFENVTIVVQDLGKPMSFEAYSQIATEQVEAVFKGGIEVIKATEFKIQGKPAYRYIFQGKNSDIIIKNMAVWTLRGNKAYQLFFTALESSYDQYVGKANRMINSFEID